MAPAEPQGSSCKLEFAVEMRCQSCADAVREALAAAPEVQLLELRLQDQVVLVESSAGAQRVQRLLEAAGRRAVLKGMGGAREGGAGGAAVAALRSPRGRPRGLLRFLQLSPGRCLVEGEVTGLPPGPHGLHVHEFGDLSDPCDSCGGHFDPEGESHGGPQDQHRHAGDLGNIWADAEGRASFRMEDPRLKVQDIIGRSVVVSAGKDDLGRGSHPLSRLTGNSGPGLACGVVARAAGLFQNPKQICSCDGLTLWDERERAAGTPPAAGTLPAAGTPGSNPTGTRSPAETPAPHL